MYKKLLAIFIVLSLALAGCSASEPAEPVNGNNKPDTVGEVIVSEPEQPSENDINDGLEEEEEIPGGKGEHTEQPVNTDTDSGQQTTDNSPLISKGETVEMFLEAWRQKDLERMDMLTLQPLEEFFRNSDILFASYYYLDIGDIAGFIRDGLETLAVYDAKALENIEIVSLDNDDSRLYVKLGDAFDMDISLEMDDNMWKLQMIDSLPAEMEKAIPEEWGNLDNSIVVDKGDLDGDGSTEIMTMGLWGEWEGMGPEPSSAIGIYSYDIQEFRKLFFKDIEERLVDDRVVTDGRVGAFGKDGKDLLVILEKTAVDEIGSIEPGDIKYYLSLYSLNEDKLELIENIDWLSVTSGWDTDMLYEPQWVELMGVQHLSDRYRSDIVIKVGYGTKDAEDVYPEVIEALFAISNRSGKWKTEWHHIGNDGEYHDVLFGLPDKESGIAKMYYTEDRSGQSGNALVNEVYFDGDAWEETPAFTGAGEIKAVTDIDEDGVNEFLVWKGNYLIILSGQGDELWRSQTLNGTKEIPFAWMGILDGKQSVIAALHRGSYVHWKSQVLKWEGEDYDLGSLWVSEDLGSQGISSMKVFDIDMDGSPEILVNFSDNYLIRGQYFRIYEP